MFYIYCELSDSVGLYQTWFIYSLHNRVIVESTQVKSTRVKNTEGKTVEWSLDTYRIFAWLDAHQKNDLILFELFVIHEYTWQNETYISYFLSTFMIYNLFNNNDVEIRITIECSFLWSIILT